MPKRKPDSGDSTTSGHSLESPKGQDEQAPAQPGRTADEGDVLSDPDPEHDTAKHHDALFGEEKSPPVDAPEASTISAAAVRHVSTAEYNAVLARIDALQRQVAIENDTSKRMQELADAAWSPPKVYTYMILAVATLVFGGNLLFQVISTMSLKSRSDDLAELVTYSRDKVDEANAKLAEFETAQRASLSNVDGKLEATVLEQEQILGELRKEVLKKLASAETAKRSQERQMDEFRQTMRAFASVYDVLGLLSLGHQRLADQQPHQAKYYAVLALNTVETTITTVKENSDFRESLLRFKRPAAILLAESEVQLANRAGILKAAAHLNERDCNCSEGNHYSGVAYLDDALDQSTNLDARRDMLRNATEALERSAVAQQGDRFDWVFLAIACFEDGQYQASFDAADRYAAFASNLEREWGQLSSRAKAQMEIAKAWAALARFSLDTSLSDLEFETDCAAVPGVLGVLEGRILRRAFLTTRQHRGQIAGPGHLSEPRKKALDEYCTMAIEAIDDLTATPCNAWSANGASSNTSHEIAENKEPEPAPAPPTPDVILEDKKQPAGPTP